MRQEVEVKRLPNGDHTKDGSFYAQVDGRPVGDANRQFWMTEEQAKECGERFVRDFYGVSP